MLKDEQKQQAAKLKDQSVGQKLSYFWTYYKWPVIGIILAFLVLGGIFSSIMNGSSDSMQIIICDNKGTDTDLSVLQDCYLSSVDTAEPLPLDFDTSMDLASDANSQTAMINIQKLIALLNGQGIDIFIAPESVFEEYGAQGMFISLDTVLSSGELSYLTENDLLVYTDLSEEALSADNSGPTTITAGIRITGHPLLESAGISMDAPCIGIPDSSAKKEAALQFLMLFLSDN